MLPILGRVNTKMNFGMIRGIGGVANTLEGENEDGV